jgi:excisionase family DNA binding protein
MFQQATEFLTPMQAARALGVSPDRIRQLTEAGQLRFSRTALGRLIDAADVERLRLERNAARRRTFGAIHGGPKPAA